MALIWETGSSDHGRWVRQGAQVGHFVIQEVRPGSVIYVDGERVREMAIQRQTVTRPDPVADAGLSLPNPRVAVNAEATRSTAPPKRPRLVRGMTVGSARTAALE